MKTWPVLGIVLLATTAHAERDRLDLMSEGAAKSNAGDHAGALAAYQQAYLQDPDPSLLPILATEYRLAGLPADALRELCTYLRVAPKGPEAAYAASQVLAIRAELGQPIAADRACEPAQPVRVDFLTPRRSPRAVPRPGRSKRELAGLATAAAGLASLGASLYYGMEARALSNELTGHDPAQPWPDDIAAIEARGERYASRRDLFLIAGGAALVTGGILYFTGRADRQAAEQVVVTPAVSATGAGVSVTRGF